VSKSKRQKFAELNTFPNVFQSPKSRVPQLRDYHGQPASLKGKWREVFGNNNPITLELACGRGEYTVALARQHPERNFIGIDLRGARLWKGARESVEGELKNAAFVRIQIEHLEQIFDRDEVDEIWITFPDPYIKKSKRRKRLTSPRFLDIYRNVLRPGGLIHLKTDSDLLHGFTMMMIDEGNHRLIERIDDVWAMPVVPEELQIKTYYENQHLSEGRTIKYLKFTLNPNQDG